MPLSTDILETQRSLIDLDAHSEGNFGFGEEYKLSFLFEDIILVEYVDEINDGHGDVIMRNGLFIPTNASTKAWRKAKVVLAGPNAQYAKVNDIVIFPNDKGVAVSNVDIEGYGLLKKGMFLNEKRLFGICKKK
jgi:cellobiose-specific phosphotransferase system component IIB